jgi:DNA-binding NtrC family response regulator
MARPTLLVVELEPGSALSTRKLVLETGKFNVLTAHSREEAAELFDLGQRLTSALIVTSDIKDYSALMEKVKKQRPGLPVILLSPSGNVDAKRADHQRSSHEPQELLDLCRNLFGDPRTIDQQLPGKGNGAANESRSDQPQ